MKEEYIKLIESELNIKREDFSEDFEEISNLNKKLYSKDIELKNIKIELEDLKDDWDNLKNELS